jgi:thioredoxin 1
MKILKFYADWCGPCKALGALIEKENLEVTNINVDSVLQEDIDLVNKYDIRNLPTLLKVDEEGNVISKEVGMLSKEDLLNFCKND